MTRPHGATQIRLSDCIGTASRSSNKGETVIRYLTTLAAAAAMTLGALAITTAPAQAQEPIPGGGVGGIANGAHVPVNVGLLGGGVGGIANGAHVPVNVGLLGTAAEVGVNLR